MNKSFFFIRDIEYIYFRLDHDKSLKHNVCDLCLKEKKQKSNQIN
jgi:hypothetical protein